MRLAARDQLIGVFVSSRLRLWDGWPVDWVGRAPMREVGRAARSAVSQAPIQPIHKVSTEHREYVRRRK